MPTLKKKILSSLVPCLCVIFIALSGLFLFASHTSRVPYDKCSLGPISFISVTVFRQKFRLFPFISSLSMSRGPWSLTCKYCLLSGSAYNRTSSPALRQAKFYIPRYATAARLYCLLRCGSRWGCQSWWAEVDKGIPLSSLAPLFL